MKHALRWRRALQRPPPCARGVVDEASPPVLHSKTQNIASSLGPLAAFGRTLPPLSLGRVFFLAPGFGGFRLQDPPPLYIGACCGAVLQCRPPPLCVASIFSRP